MALTPGSPFPDLVLHWGRATNEELRRDLREISAALLSDASHFEGSVVVARGAGAARIAADPFARIFPGWVLHVDAGLFGSVPPPAGPVIERYGSARPWPADRF